MLDFVAEQASLSLTWSETPEDTFSHDEAQIVYISYFDFMLSMELIYALVHNYNKTDNLAIYSCHFRTISYEPRHEKTCLQGVRLGDTQTGLLSWWD